MSKAAAETRHDEMLDALPISTNELMLGVTVHIPAQAMYCEMHDLRPRGGMRPEPRIRAVGGERSTDLLPGSRQRTYIAAWARRNLHRPVTSGDN